MSFHKNFRRSDGEMQIGASPGQNPSSTRHYLVIILRKIRLRVLDGKVLAAETILTSPGGDHVTCLNLPPAVHRSLQYKIAQMQQIAAAVIATARFQDAQEAEAAVLILNELTATDYMQHLRL